ncbi:hypothetical protein QBC43DRAFT_336080 [Cladorrhinum sp. PSN259]|nr:hypothetical protein QBC43DRAFT_336080 [Cladorrhinum sp. PSN259]
MFSSGFPQPVFIPCEFLADKGAPSPPYVPGGRNENQTRQSEPLSLGCQSSWPGSLFSRLTRQSRAGPGAISFSRRRSLFPHQGRRLGSLKAWKDSRYHWPEILIPGELKSNPEVTPITKAWLDISTYAREVLAAQDTCRFGLDFTICGSFMRIFTYGSLIGFRPGLVREDLNFSLLLSSSTDQKLTVSAVKTGKYFLVVKFTQKALSGDPRLQSYCTTHAILFQEHIYKRRTFARLSRYHPANHDHDGHDHHSHSHSDDLPSQPDVSHPATSRDTTQPGPGQTCPHPHCGRLITPVNAAHHDNHHGTYECAIGSCASYLEAHPSRFSEESLRHHLRVHHAMGPKIRRKAAAGIKTMEVNVVYHDSLLWLTRKDEWTPKGGRRMPWTDCVVCSAAGTNQGSVAAAQGYDAHDSSVQGNPAQASSENDEEEE